MKTFKIFYKWREADMGQACRPWQADFKFEKAASADEAEQQFRAAWFANSEFEIVETQACTGI